MTNVFEEHSVEQLVDDMINANSTKKYLTLLKDIVMTQYFEHRDNGYSPVVAALQAGSEGLTADLLVTAARLKNRFVPTHKHTAADDELRTELYFTPYESVFKEDHQDVKTVEKVLPKDY